MVSLTASVWAFNDEIVLAARPSGLASGLALAVRPAGLAEAPGSTARRRRVPRSGIRSTDAPKARLAGGAGPDNARRTGPGPVTRSRRSAHLAQRLRPGRGAGVRGSGIRRVPQAASHWGAVRGLPPRRRTCVRRTRRSGPPRNGEPPGLNPRRDGGSPWPLIPSQTARVRPSLFAASAVRPGAPEVRP
jgi:hypothetical protein